MKEFNIEKAKAEEISRLMKPFPPDGVIAGHPGKTPDLSKVLMSLRGTMLNPDVRVASYYLYLQAN